MYGKMTKVKFEFIVSPYVILWHWKRGSWPLLIVFVTHLSDFPSEGFLIW